MTIISIMLKRQYIEHKLDAETLKQLKKRAIDLGITQADMVTNAIIYFLDRTYYPIDNQSNQD
jgi:hypothetical protein